MIKIKLKGIISGLLILLSAVSFAKNIEGVNNNSYDANTVFILDFEVKLYKDEVSDKIIQKLNYFDPLEVLSESINNKDRIKIKLQSGTEGWVEEKYTSIIPKDWIKKPFNKNYYCYTLPDQIMNFTKREKDNAWSHTEYRNKNYYINYGIIYIMKYYDSIEQYKEGIKNCIMAGHDKRLNWQKEFIYGNYRVNYTITTDDPERWIIESFNFVPLNEEKEKKYYSFSTTYKQSNSFEQRLIQRKILFSALQSLR
jgi:hypothetical protein